jgi:hypothetical protein
VIRAAVVIDLDEFVVRSAGTANPELADDQLRVRGRNGQERAQADQPGAEHYAKCVSWVPIKVFHVFISWHADEKAALCSSSLVYPF